MTRDLVECLARRVVDGLTQQAVLRIAFDDHDHRVTARDDEHREGQLDVRILEPGRVQMRLEMVHADVRDIEGERERLGRTHADEERTGETRAVARGDGIDVGEARTRLHERFGDDAADELGVRATRDLGHHAAEARVKVDLTRHDAGTDVVPVVDHGGRSLVAAGLDAQDGGHAQRRTGSKMVSPSMPRSIVSRSMACSGESMWRAHITTASSLVSA